MTGGSLLGKTKMISVHRDFVEDALETRYEDVKDLWGNDASISLWPEKLEHLLETGEFEYPVSYYVDNYLVNGDFITREENQSDTEWENYCNKRAYIYNSKYACL